MEVQINPKFTDEQPIFSDGKTTFLLTPPIDGDYWLIRVPLTDTQAIVAFPKFFTIGIGFQREEDWNTNLPYTCGAHEIYSHIAHNKGDDTISDAVLAAEADYSRMMGLARQQLADARNVAYARLEAAIRKAVGR